MGIVRDLYYARKMSAGLKLPAPTVALLIKRLRLAAAMGGGIEKTISGTMVHITDALAKAALSVLASIEPIQDLHGYDHPWPAGGGKNKLSSEWQSGSYGSNGNKINDDTKIRTASAINVSANTTYTLSFAVARSGSGLVCYYTDDAFISRASIVAVNPTFTTPATCTRVTFAVLVESDGTTPKAQLEIGSSPTAWSPYSNICPITGRTGLSVYRTGVNVWDEVWELGGINGSGNNQSGTDRIRSKNYIPVTPGATYYYYINSTYGIYAWGYDSSKTYVGRIPSNGWAISNNTVTIPSGVYYIRIVVQPGYGTTYNNDISINYPSTDHSYHAYNGTTYAVDWTSEAGTVYGGTLDVVTGVLTVDRAMVDLGTLNYTYDSVGRFYTSINGKKNEASDRDMMLAISSMYMPMTATAFQNTPTDCTMRGATTGGYVYFRNSAYTDAATFKTAMSGVQLCYELATPLTYQLTPQEVQMLLGENYVWASSGDTVSVTYYAEGNANPLQSLNILLGGRYSNPKTADDVSDKEALEIILGGNK